MIEFAQRIAAALVVGCILCLSTVKMLGIMQQTGYQNSSFWRWLKRKDNLFFNRLWVLALCLALATSVVALCFSFLGARWALLLSALPFFALLLIFWLVDGKYALKVPVKRTGRLSRLFGIYYFFTALFAYILIALLGFLAEWNGSKLYGLVAYAPFAVMPVLLPVALWLANVVTAPFENARNRKFVKRAKEKLQQTQITRIAVVGSYGKTSVKNILKTLLSEKYETVETPSSYNTPMGIAMTVFSEAFENKQVFIAEMGARKEGDIAELCALVQPDYALFTGVCPQHIASFGSEEKVFAEKSNILSCGAKKVICGENLKEKVGERENVLFAGASQVENLRLSVSQTEFALSLGEETIEVKTKLLGRSAAENIALAAKLCYEMGMSAGEIVAGIEKLQPVPHRLQLLENNGVRILDDGYNCNIEGAKVALETLSFAEGRKYVVTPGIVEGGILEETLNRRLGEEIAQIKADALVLVGETLVSAVKEGYKQAGGEEEKLTCAQTLSAASELLATRLQTGDTVLFLNDLPDIY